MTASPEDASLTDNEPPSKSAVKRAFKAQQAFARTLVDTPEKFLTQLGLSETVMDEVRLARTLSKSALKRQIGFISKRMTDEDIAGAEQTLANLQQPDASANARFHELEQWRDELLNGDESQLIRLVDDFGADRQQLRTLVRNAQRERDSEQPPKSARLLFKYLRQLSED